MDKPALLREAQNLANQFSTDAQRRLLHHAVRFVWRNRNPAALRSFLQTRHHCGASQRNWEQVATILRPVVTSHSPAELAYILGWAVRLRPSAESDSSASSSANPA